MELLEEEKEDPSIAGSREEDDEDWPEKESESEEELSSASNSMVMEASSSMVVDRRPPFNFCGSKSSRVLMDFVTGGTGVLPPLTNNWRNRGARAAEARDNSAVADGDNSAAMDCQPLTNNWRKRRADKAETADNSVVTEQPGPKRQQTDVEVVQPDELSGRKLQTQLHRAEVNPFVDLPLVDAEADNSVVTDVAESSEVPDVHAFRMAMKKEILRQDRERYLALAIENLANQPSPPAMRNEATENLANPFAPPGMFIVYPVAPPASVGSAILGGGERCGGEGLIEIDESDI